MSDERRNVFAVDRIECSCGGRTFCRWMVTSYGIFSNVLVGTCADRWDNWSDPNFKSTVVGTYCSTVGYRLHTTNDGDFVVRIALLIIALRNTAEKQQWAV